MRRALSTSRLIASVVATFLYLSFEEAMRARAARAADRRGTLEEPKPLVRRQALSVHDRPTLPGTVGAPVRDLVEISPAPRISSIGGRVPAPRVWETPREAPQPRPAVLFAVPEDEGPAEEEANVDVATLLETLRRDAGCGVGESHEACRAAEALARFVDRDAVLTALEETVTAAGRPRCVGVAGVRALGGSSRAAARGALVRMLSVARGRADWGLARADRDLVALLCHTLDAKG